MATLGDRQLADLSRRAAATASREAGVVVKPSLLRALIQQESGGNPRAGSPAGAQGLTQLMPATAKGLGVRNVYDPWQNVLGGARYLAAQLKRFDDPRLALSAYNSGPGGAESGGQIEGYAETQNYVKRVMALEAQYRNIQEGGATSLPGVPSRPVEPAMPTGGAASPEPSAGLAPGSSLADIMGFVPGTPSPELNRERLMGGEGLTAVGPLSEMTVAASQQMPNMVGPKLADFMRSAQMARQQQQGELPPPMANVMPDDDDAGPVGDAAGNWQEWVKDPEVRQGPSKHHTPAILRAVGMLGQRMGKKLAPWGNESHSKMTTSGNVSAHYSGNAADIPGSGKQLAEMGRQALIMAGMDPDQAELAARKGGLYNVGGYQIIFNTNEGGNHYDHLHLGLRSRR
jgi:Transglycosylase SLT domain